MRTAESVRSDTHLDHTIRLLLHQDPERSGGIDIHALIHGRNGRINIPIDTLTYNIQQENRRFGTLVSAQNIGILLDYVESPVGTPDQIVDMHNLALDSLEPRHIIPRIAQGSINFIDTRRDYERLFAVTQLSRRTQRRTPTAVDTIPPELVDLMDDWLDLGVDINSPPSPESMVPDNMGPFETMFKLYMPARLDVDSWVARQLFKTYGSVDQEPGMPDGNFRKFEPSRDQLGRRAVFTQPDGTSRVRPTFYGEAKVGSIVFLPKYGLESPVTQNLLNQLYRILIRRKALEDALVSLSRRIARYVVKIVMVLYVLPEQEKLGRKVLDRDRIGRAVEEILGPAWFDLPFDLSNKLRSWSVDEVLKPDDELQGSDVFPD